jgi:hypothetical protein
LFIAFDADALDLNATNITQCADRLFFNGRLNHFVVWVVDAKEWGNFAS